jgi:hypothetical protein
MTFFRDHLIVSLQARGIVTLVERRNLAREWVKDYVRGRWLYREKNARAVGLLGDS